MDHEKEYCNKAWELLEDARETEWSIWDRDADELIYNVSDVMSCVFHLSQTASTLLDMRRMRDEGHEMCFEDYAMDYRLLEHLEMLMGKVRYMQSIIEKYTKRLVDESPKDEEIQLGDILASCDKDEALDEVCRTARGFCVARRNVYQALLPLFMQYRKILVETVRLFRNERADFVSLWKAEYEAWLEQHRQDIERRLKNGLYKSSIYGKTILPLPYMFPSRENWGEALCAKMQQIRVSDIFRFIDNCDFYEVDHPIQLTEPLLTMTLDYITKWVSTANLDELSYGKRMEMLFLHIAEINILKEKMEAPYVAVKDSELKQEEGSAVDNGNSDGDDEQPVYPAMPLLERLVKAAIQEGKKPKYILMPVRAAREAGVSIPINDVKSMNKHFGTSLTKQNWSQWVNGTARCGYDSKEMNPLITQFRKLT